jgi:RHS repeat-associated protein
LRVTRNYLYGYDPHNNVSQLLGEAGSVRASYGYTVYGEHDGDETAELKLTGNPGSDESQFTDELSPLNPYRYSDKRYDSGSEQLDMGARRYGPDVGQFLQEDVFKDALGELGLSTDPLTQNRYSLAAGNPVSFIEADGHVVTPVDVEDSRKITRRHASAGVQIVKKRSQPTITSGDAAQGTEPGVPTPGTRTKENLAHPDQPGQGEGGATFFKALDLGLNFAGISGAIKKGVQEGVKLCIKQCDNLIKRALGHTSDDAARTLDDAAAKARPPIAGGAPGTSIRIGDQQFGAKVGQHARDFGLDPASPADRARFREIVEDIATRPDRVATGTFRGRGPEGAPGPVSFRVKGSDVVVASPADEFITVLRGGINNPSVRRALGE